MKRRREEEEVEEEFLPATPTPMPPTLSAKFRMLVAAPFLRAYDIETPFSLLVR